MSLMFQIEQGIIAGHDVGFDMYDFLSHFMSLNAEGKARLQKDIISSLERLCVCVGGHRIDGSNSDVDNMEWLTQQKAALRVFDKDYYEHSVIKYLHAVASISESSQTRFASFGKHKFLCADPVKVSSIYDVLSNHEIKFIKEVIKPRPKACYEDAYNMCMLGDFKYVEGVCFSLIPFDHAFNEVRDGVYVDVTLELGLGLDVTSLDYVKLMTCDESSLSDFASASGVYGNYFIDRFNSKFK